MDTAKVYLVGAGLGDPELLTRRAEKLLSTADAVIYDRSVNPQILALINPEARSIPTDASGSLEERTADVCGWYLRVRESCASVVRLTGADPLMEGELGEEMEFLTRHGFQLEVIPGVIAETVYECRAAVREAQKNQQDLKRAS
ncbi:MAG: SAM-dependent methyltransferase [Bryobacteraceae bacterium]